MIFRGDSPRRPVLRHEYRPPAWLVDQVELDLALDYEQTRVGASLSVRRNPAAMEPEAPLVLSGVGLETRRVELDGRVLDDRAYRLEGEELIIPAVPQRAVIRTEVCVRPAANTELEGLYASGRSLLTQCEAEGFRKITWFPDRPDVMASYRVRLQADADQFPVLLSNGNLVESGRLPRNRHFACWDDPFPKPSYLFAVVAGDLAVLEDELVTASGRTVALKIYSERENLARLDHAMASLKHAMEWDARRFGLEYDLDVYHIVATHDFNMGAMENKSLNIFNARFVLADPQTATDADYLGIESVVAHEYFHNWTGNRVTLRDWFQLTLKEGLTVFRDQEFTAERHSAAVKRITDVRDLMERQFPEDAGPMAHAVRPERYIEINNFYTATVYEKGAEIVRMVQTLLGVDGFERGLALYIRRHDGQAATCDDFLAAMAAANDRDLSAFGRWYRQVGTPRVRLTQQFEPASGTLELYFEQSLPAQGENASLGALVIPIAVGLLDRHNRPLPVTLEGESHPGPLTRVLVVDQPDQRVRIIGLQEPPLVSALRGYSAPIQLEFDCSDEDLARLLAHDPDPVARWLAGRRLALRLLDRAVAAVHAGGLAAVPGELIEAWRRIVEDRALEPALAAELLELPGETEIAQRGAPVEVEAIHAARTQFFEEIAKALEPILLARYRSLAEESPWQFDAVSCGRRRLRNQILMLLGAGHRAIAGELAYRMFEAAENMTDRLGSLQALITMGDDRAGRALERFAARHADNPLVMDKWFAVQAGHAHPGTVETVAGLLKHPAFALTNPNKVRAVLGTFGLRNPLAFHRADGAGYELFGTAIAELDRINPQVASKMVAAFNRWRAYPAGRARLMRAQLEAIRRLPALSADVEEIVEAALRAPG